MSSTCENDINVAASKTHIIFLLIPRWEYLDNPTTTPTTINPSNNNTHPTTTPTQHQQPKHMDNPPPKRRRKKNTLSEQLVRIQNVKGTTGKWMKSLAKTYRTVNHTDKPLPIQVRCHSNGPVLQTPTSHFHENSVVRYQCSFCNNTIQEVMTVHYNPTLPKPYVFQCQQCLYCNE